jgi:hypothetical protein
LSDGIRLPSIRGAAAAGDRLFAKGFRGRARDIPLISIHTGFIFATASTSAILAQEENKNWGIL